MELTKMPIPSLPTDSENLEAYATINGLRILKSIDNTSQWGKLKHISISKEDRYPSWDEILEIKEKLFGDVDCMMVMPKKKNYVNIHSFCFHIWETPESWNLR